MPRIPRFFGRNKNEEEPLFHGLQEEIKGAADTRAADDDSPIFSGTVRDSIQDDKIHETEPEAGSERMTAIDFLRSGGRDPLRPGAKRSDLYKEAWEKRQGAVDITSAAARLDRYDDIIKASEEISETSAALRSAALMGQGAANPPRVTAARTPAHADQGGSSGLSLLRVLHVFSSLELSGEMVRLMDLYRALDRSQIQFDFVVHVSAEDINSDMPGSDELMRRRQPGFFDAEITRLGGHIYALPRPAEGRIFAYKDCFTRLLASHRGRWSIVEAHDLDTAALYLSIASKEGLGTILHASSAIPPEENRNAGFYTSVTQALSAADFCVAGSKAGAVSVFGKNAVKEKKILVTRDGVSASKYVYSARKRLEVRKRMGIRDGIIVGYVAAFNEDQNHEFALEIFDRVLGIIGADKGAGFAAFRGLPLYLFMPGDGPLRKKVLEKARDLGIIMQVMVPGILGNIWDYYQVMDYYICPTMCGGVPQSLIEAQACGLPCLAADNVSNEADITGLVTFKTLGASAEAWAADLLAGLVKSGCGQRSRAAALAGYEAAWEESEQRGAAAVGEDATMTKLSQLLRTDEVTGELARPVSKAVTEPSHFAKGVYDREALSAGLKDKLRKAHVELDAKIALMQRFYKGLTPKG
ncbi:glycosyltransferase [Butyrivibrio sp. MC2013]|uniref:glycosyltransferase n=1 Tax=Butyrivibrio sp. MC2013 TaxID=1280686 RepID=UPI00047BA025|nr:glycosyltransferase [Butyrivibrio sp. MC2013]